MKGMEVTEIVIIVTIFVVVIGIAVYFIYQGFGTADDLKLRQVVVAHCKDWAFELCDKDSAGFAIADDLSFKDACQQLYGYDGDNWFNGCWDLCGVVCEV